MSGNLHAPERFEGESFQDYRRRRIASKRVTRMVLAGQLARPDHIGSRRGHAIKALGGIRQYKRAQYLRRYPDYAGKHPAITQRKGS
jgi:hypothetical protein